MKLEIEDKVKVVSPRIPLYFDKTGVIIDIRHHGKYPYHVKFPSMVSMNNEYFHAKELEKVEGGSEKD
ncbi:MAG: hypothetical protein KAV98_06010 [Dehalococcoidia bacterium]|nr:hypothetical protein [Dehalococcoidia bacterium]